MRRKITILTLAALSLVFFIALQNTTTTTAQTGGAYSLEWSTIDDGGKYSAGGPFWVGGTIGQADASAPLVGGNFELTGGFWYIKVQNPTAVQHISTTVQSEQTSRIILAILLLIVTVWMARRKPKMISPK